MTNDAQHFPAPSAVTQPRPDAPGWYQCRFKNMSVVVVRWWDGEQIMHGPGNKGYYGVEEFTDFIGPLAPGDECATYHVPRIAELERLLAKAQEAWADAITIVGDIEQCRGSEGDSIHILCDNPEADSVEIQAAVEGCGGYTDYEPQRFYGKTWSDALSKAANAARRFYRENEDYE